MRKKHWYKSKAGLMILSGFLICFLSGNAAYRQPLFLPSAKTSPPEEPSNPSSLNSILQSALEDAREQEELFGDAPEQPFLSRMILNISRSAQSLSESFLSLETQDNGEYKPSVLNYNLMSVYPETEPVSEEINPEQQESFLYMMQQMQNWLQPLCDLLGLDLHNSASYSYGGKMYEYLNQKDAQWTSEIYQWMQASPEKAALMMGRSSASVTGRYDPTNKKHDPENPATWVIPSWKSVNFRFYDGDGNPITLRSNTQEIISMANVYTYYQDWQDTEQFRVYADHLWDASHSYHAGMGEVYYCEGCVNPDEVTDSEANEPQDAAPAAAEPQEEAQDSIQESQPEGPGGPAAAASPSELPAVSAASELPADTAAEEAGTPPQEQDKPDSEQRNAVSESADAAEAFTEEGIDSEHEIVPDTELQLNAEGKFCPGHVDLTITGTIIGLSEHRNLFTIDQTGRETNESWRGWSAYNMAYVHSLSNQDWMIKYGLTTLELALGTPLSLGEINEYMSLLPEELSAERRTVIRHALESVGKIPYYYGGKAKSADYDSNQFGSLTVPDRKGRALTGLDCSGWVNWIYWSALGQQPSHLGTSGLVHAGKAINRSELQAGDIIVRLGSNSHVMMFLAWAPNGSMICVHETGMPNNNVIVSTVSSSWPNYRSLLD